jgi:hypothetical protein
LYRSHYGLGVHLFGLAFHEPDLGVWVDLADFCCRLPEELVAMREHKGLATGSKQNLPNQLSEYQRFPAASRESNQKPDESPLNGGVHGRDGVALVRTQCKCRAHRALSVVLYLAMNASMSRLSMRRPRRRRRVFSGLGIATEGRRPLLTSSRVVQ